MRKQGEFHPVVTLLDDDDFDHRVRRVVDFHTTRGWRVKRAHTVARGAMPLKFGSRADIEDGRGESPGDPPLDQTPIELVLEPSRELVRLGAHERVVQLGTSSIDATPTEHAVEILLQKESGRRSTASLRELVQDLHPAFAGLGSSLFRGPSLAELRQQATPSRVELEKIFMSRGVLAESSANLLAGLEIEHWGDGILVSGDSVLVTKKCWPVLRKWAYTLS